MDYMEYVRSLYRDVLGRDGSEEAVRAYADWARNSGASQDVLRDQFMSDAQAELAAPTPYSMEDARNITAGFYDKYLGRAPDDAGMAYWTSQLTGGHSPDNMAAYLQNIGMLGERVNDGSANFRYQDAARSYTAGLNRMPSVFSDAGNLPASPGGAQAVIFPPAMNAWRADVQNPVLATQQQAQPGNPLFNGQDSTQETITGTDGVTYDSQGNVIRNRMLT